MGNYTAVFSGREGRKRGNNVRVMQNSIETDLVFDCYNQDGTSYVFEAGDVVTGSFVDNGDYVAYGVTGTITPSVGASAITWERVAADVGLVGTFTISFKVVSSGGDIDHTVLVQYVVIEVPDGTVTPPSPLVGVPAADAAWLVLAVAANPTAVTWLPQDAGTATALVDNPAALVASISAATYAIDSTLYRHVELTLDHIAPVISITGAVVGSGLVCWLIQGTAGTAVVDLTAINWGDGTATVVPLVAGEKVAFIASYVDGEWTASDHGVIY